MQNHTEYTTVAKIAVPCTTIGTVAIAGAIDSSRRIDRHINININNGRLQEIHDG